MIVLLASDDNSRGHLFERMTRELFSVLGYESCHLNVKGSGREVDVVALHRREDRQAVGECKATSRPVGGDVVNKFVGVLDVERRLAVYATETVGYLISLSGFTETARRQELERGDPRLILLDADDLVSELVRGRVLVSLEHATAQAGQCALDARSLVLDTEPDLLAHEIGWVWAIYFLDAGLRSHVALIHADGYPLNDHLCNQIADADARVGGRLGELEILPSRPSSGAAIPHQMEAARARYLRYLQTECGTISLEGLPADREVGSRQLALEALFVPLRLQILGSDEELEATPTRGSTALPIGSAREADRSAAPIEQSGRSLLRPSLLRPLPSVSTVFGPAVSLATESTHRHFTDPVVDEHPVHQIQDIGETLLAHERIAILAAPGAGKTCLISRLATAYAFPERRQAVDDSLPDRRWFPLLLRCRQLGPAASLSMVDILRSIASRAEMADVSDGFVEMFITAFRTGDALLLIDGLDELTDDRTLLAFVRQLRTVLSVYPRLRAVVTSREPGFRIVAGAAAALFQQARIAELDDASIRRLTLAWHREVLGDTSQVSDDAERLADFIVRNDRVRAMATTPLLLMTLLLVRRWVGDLPRRRTVLYGKAIEVLLMTWNREGHEALDQEEAIPQLAYVAFQMTTEQTQRLSAKRLASLLTDARKQMPEVLGYARMSVANFVRRVEDRSSLMVQTGHIEEDGIIQPLYEFKHLSIQEYLTALALVDGYYRNNRGTDMEQILASHVDDPAWREVIPLAIVLAGRRAEVLMDVIVASVIAVPSRDRQDGTSPHRSELLLRCLGDEPQLSPSAVNLAVEAVIRRYPASATAREWSDALSSRYGERFLALSRVLHATATSDIGSIALAIDQVIRVNGYSIGQARTDIDPTATGLAPEVLTNARAGMASADPLERIRATIIIREVASGIYDQIRAPRPSVVLTTEVLTELRSCSQTLITIIRADEGVSRYFGYWAAGWIGALQSIDPDVLNELISMVFDGWRSATDRRLRERAAWCLWRIPIAQRSARVLGSRASGDLEFVRNELQLDVPGYEDCARAAVVAGYYLGAPWSDEQLREHARQAFVTEPQKREVLLALLGE